NALAVAPGGADFSERVRANAAVTAVFRDRVFSSPSGQDVSTATGATPGALPPGAGSFPDPWHDAASFWGVTNPEGILQWDDARMDVPAAWRTTLGSRAVRVAGMLDACSDGFDIVNMSITGYLDPSVPEDADDYLLWTDAAQYCRDHGAAVFAAAGNEHVRVNRVAMTLGGRALGGVGRVST